jgi:Putative peptidoglycan binding domain/Penicillin-insensitive murein endopeptidase
MSDRFRLALIALSVALLSLTGAGTAAAATPSYPHQSVGNRGSDVRALQGFLRHHGATDLVVSGIYDIPTVAAVRDFQAARGLPVTGMVNGPTWGRFLVSLRPGATGEAVAALQRQLNEKRLVGLIVDSAFGPATLTAVRSFQRHAGLPITGVVDAATWRYLISHFERPSFGRWLCDYQVGKGLADWGTGAAIGQIERAAVSVVRAGHGRVAVGDIGHEHGGDIAGHQTHERGLDVDVRPMRRDENQCRWGVNFRSSAYDRAATRDLIKAMRAAAPGHVKLIYFNDPVLIREGLSRYHAGHDDHVHVRYCERVYPIAAYDC